MCTKWNVKAAKAQLSSKNNLSSRNLIRWVRRNNYKGKTIKCWLACATFFTIFVLGSREMKPAPPSAGFRPELQVQQTFANLNTNSLRFTQNVRLKTIRRSEVVCGNDCIPSATKQLMLIMHTHTYITQDDL